MGMYRQIIVLEVTFRMAVSTSRVEMRSNLCLPPRRYRCRPYVKPLVPVTIKDQRNEGALPV